MGSAPRIPRILRPMTAATLGIPESKLRVIAPDVGGGFGGKISIIPEEMLAALVSQKLGKPVKWIDEVLQRALKDTPQPIVTAGEEKPAVDGKPAGPKRPGKRAGNKVHAH